MVENKNLVATVETCEIFCFLFLLLSIQLSNWEWAKLCQFTFHAFCYKLSWYSVAILFSLCHTIGSSRNEIAHWDIDWRGKISWKQSKMLKTSKKRTNKDVLGRYITLKLSESGKTTKWTDVDEFPCWNQLWQILILIVIFLCSRFRLTFSIVDLIKFSFISVQSIWYK